MGIKKISYYVLALLVSSASLFSCQKAHEEVDDSGDGISTVIMRLSPFKGETDDTRTEYSFDSGTNTFTFLWAEGDAVGIVSSEGSQMKFPVQEQFYGQVDAEFDGRGFALVSGSRYASYTPFIPDYDINPEAVPVDYTGQVQRGDDNTSHLGAYGFSAAIGSAPSSGMLYFTYQNIGSPHRYRMPVLPGTYSSLTVSVDEASYVTKGTFNLNAEDEASLITLTPSETSESLHLDLVETTMSSVGNLRCWMMVAPTNLTGKVIRMRLERPDGTALISAVAGADCPANYRKLFSSKTSVYPAEEMVEAWSEDVMEDDALASRCFAEAFYAIKESGLESMRGYIPPEKGGDLIPISRRETQILVGQIYAGNACRDFSERYPFIGHFLKAKEGVPSGLIAADVESFFRSGKGRTYPLEQGFVLAVEKISSDLQAQCGRIVRGLVHAQETAGDRPLSQIGIRISLDQEQAELFVRHCEDQYINCHRRVLVA